MIQRFLITKLCSTFTAFRAWSGDKLALQICLEAVGKELDKKLSLIARCRDDMAVGYY